MTYESQEKLLADSVFQVKVIQGMTTTALNVVGEAQGENQEANDKRHNLGVEILTNVHTHEDSFRRAIAALGTIDASNADGDFAWGVSTVFNDIAGVSGVPV